MSTSEPVMVYGAAGHTGRFVVDELLRRGLTPVLAGRRAAPLADAARRHAGIEQRVVGLGDTDLLRRAIEGVDVVVNCAGPFLDTALPLATAAIATGGHYLDVSAEQPAVAELYHNLDRPARDAGVALVPAMAFYGGLADLLVTDALDGETSADAVEIAIGLDRWWPTAGTRATGARNTATRQVIRNGVLAPLPDPAPTGTWSYPPPLGDQPVVQLPLSEVLTISRHLRVGELTSYLNSSSLADLRDESTPPPPTVDATGRSAQQFVVDIAVRRGTATRRLTASGRDIYAITAPIVVEGVVRLLDGHHAVGAVAPGEAYDAADVLAALAAHPAGLTLGTSRMPSADSPTT